MGKPISSGRLTLPDFVSIERARRGRSLVVLDPAVPRDFDPATGDRPGVYTYAVDDLQAACEHHPPLESLRRECRHGVPTALLQSFGRLFRFQT